jgi:hypothetical protein
MRSPGSLGRAACGPRQDETVGRLCRSRECSPSLPRTRIGHERACSRATRPRSMRKRRGEMRPRSQLSLHPSALHAQDRGRLPVPVLMPRLRHGLHTAQQKCGEPPPRRVVAGGDQIQKCVVWMNFYRPSALLDNGRIYLFRGAAGIVGPVRAGYSLPLRAGVKAPRW